MTVLLILNGISFANRVDFRRLYWVTSSTEKSLRTPEKKSSTFDPIAFDKINSKNDVRNYMGVIACKFLQDLKDANNSKEDEQIKFIDMKIRILTTKIRESNCHKNDIQNDIQCYHSDYLKYFGILNDIFR